MLLVSLVYMYHNAWFRECRLGQYFDQTKTISQSLNYHLLYCLYYLPQAMSDFPRQWIKETVLRCSKHLLKWQNLQTDFLRPDCGFMAWHCAVPLLYTNISEEHAVRLKPTWSACNKGDNSDLEEGKRRQIHRTSWPYFLLWTHENSFDHDNGGIGEVRQWDKRDQ
jgi:hypothetical protein